MNDPFRRRPALIAVLALVVACSTSQEKPEGSEDGGSLLGGGTNDVSGGDSAWVGGRSGAATGGAERGGAAGGGTSPAGGVPGLGGNSSSGGSPNTSGGAATRGGSPGVGGSTAGGRPGNGGNTSWGGSPSGGSPGDGGAVALAGSPGDGGTIELGGDFGEGGIAQPGGSPGQGGVVGSGGSLDQGGAGECVETNCGTHKWACWPMPNPASSSDTVPHHARYTDRGDGTVKDEITCLVWEKTNPGNVGNWQANFERCAELAALGFAGYSDWRLPTRIEMASISDVTLGSTGYPSVFDTTTGYYVTGSFWYKTILTDGEEDRVWGYGTNGFTSNAIVRSDDGLVARCVRGNGTGEGANDYAVEPPEHYSLGTDTVTDNTTGLTWQRGRSPSMMAFDEAPGYCAGLSLDGLDGWRVPTLNELATTVNEAKVGGAIVEEAFPDNPNGCKKPEFWFWAAEASLVGGEGWGLSYCDGFTGWNAGADGDWNYFPTANVRCVR